MENPGNGNNAGGYAVAAADFMPQQLHQAEILTDARLIEFLVLAAPIVWGQIRCARSAR